MDAPTFGRRLDDIRNDFTLPPHLNMANFAGMGEKKTGVNDQVCDVARCQIGEINPELLMIVDLLD